MKIDKVSLAVEIEGKPYFVILGQEKLKLLVDIASGLADNEKLNVIKAPDDFKFSTMDKMAI